MADTVFWKRVDEDIWHKITSDTEITWEQEFTEGETIEGQCPTYYDVTSSGTREYYGVYPWGPITKRVLGPIGATYTWSGARKYGFYCTDGNGSEVVLSGATSPFYVYTGSINNIVRVDGGEDNCFSTESECVTTFSTGFSVTAPECVQVTRQPDDCPCCESMLPRASRILSLLS